MPQGVLPFQYAAERISTGMTAMAGLGVYLDMMAAAGLWESVRRHVGIKGMSQGWTDIQMITSLVLLNVAGGESVSDLNVLEGDEGLGRLLRRMETHGMRRCEREAMAQRWRVGRQRSVLTLVASALAGGDFIDDADVLRRVGTAGAIGCVVKAPSTLGTFLRSFRWGHVRQLDRVSRELLSRAWAAGAGPGEGPLTIDLDSTMCETYGLAKEGARHHGYTGQRGYHPLLAIAAGTGDVLMSRLREGRANTVRGAAHFLRETVGRVRHAGARGQLTVRADSGFYAHALVVVCRKMDVRFSITIRQHARLRELIEAIPEKDWTPVPYWMDGGADVAETTYTPFKGEPEAAPVRLIVRRVKPTPGSQLALFASYSYHGFITDRDGDTLELEADHRRHAEIENAIRDLKHGVGLNHLPSGRFPANAAWLAMQVLAHNLARWTARIGLDEGVVTTRTLRRRFFSLAGRLTRSARRLTLHLPKRWPWETQFTRALARLRALTLPA